MNISAKLKEILKTLVEIRSSPAYNPKWEDVQTNLQNIICDLELLSENIEVFRYNDNEH